MLEMVQVLVPLLLFMLSPVLVPGVYHALGTLKERRARNSSMVLHGWSVLPEEA
ncbi:hypothetical protein [Skermania sp. ID1734]|uniref:hypothetical protein n=1 Tax=Skermania sp. ID1734 TaxID=2597516 RepID=UPI00163D52D9|nr:hypothetical protein [Skermania sp. ID1734]